MTRAMTESGDKWLKDVNRKRVPGGEVGIVHPIDADSLLRAFCAEVERRAHEVDCKRRAARITIAFDELKRELLG